MVTLTRSRVEGPLVVARPVDVILSGRESTVEMLDVNCGICREPDLLPVVMSTDDLEPLAVPVVALTRSRVEGHLIVAQPVNVDTISRAAVYPDLLSGGVMKSVDPAVGSGDPMSLKTIPDTDGYACHSVWRDMVLDDVVREKFIFVPEVCPVGSMTGAAEPTCRRRRPRSNMKRLHAFLEEMDEEWLRQHAQEMEARMSLSSGRDSTDGSADVTTGLTVTRRTGSRGQRQRTSLRGAGSSCALDMVFLPPAEASTVQPLMDLSFPHFAGSSGH